MVLVLLGARSGGVCACCGQQLFSFSFSLSSRAEGQSKARGAKRLL
jgi:hypothetical protein